MLSGIRKFNVSLTLSHQYMGQLSKDFSSALIGNCGTTIAFRTGIDDAEALEHVFPVDNLLTSLDKLAPHEARVLTPGFQKSVEMPDQEGEPDEKLRKKLLGKNRLTYASARAHVEAKVEEFIKNA